MATRDDFIGVCLSLHHTRWKHEGRDRNGIDCAGVVHFGGWETGLLPRSVNIQGYSRQPSTFDFVSYFDQHMTRKHFADRRPGDVLLHRQSLYPCHCSVLFEWKGRGEYLVHANALRQVHGQRRPGRVTFDPLPGAWQACAFSFCYQFAFED